MRTACVALSFFVAVCCLTAEEIALVKDSGVYKVNAEINGTLTLHFVIDSGAAVVMIPADVVSTLKRTGTLSDRDFRSEKTYRMANGTTERSAGFLIRKLRVGETTVANVEAAIGSPAGELLLGQSFLNKIGIWSLDSQRGVLILGNREQASPTPRPVRQEKAAEGAVQGSKPAKEAATPAGAPSQTAANGPHGMRFVLVKAGTFTMGSPENEQGLFEGQHQVTLRRDFEMAETPVTQAQWEAVMGSNPSVFKQSGSDAPVENVSWNDAVEWCTKMSEQDSGWTYRLPTEAEWEYACRAGTLGAYNVDGASLKDLGWFHENAGGRTHSVKQKRANSWGLYDMHGNVEEWCADWHGFPTEAATDPKGPDKGDARVLRGGGWDSYDRSCRSAFRDFFDPGYRYSDIGFRPVRQKKAPEGIILKYVSSFRGAAPGSKPTKEAATPAGARIQMAANGPHGMNFVPVKAGTFTMGSPNNEQGRRADEVQHEVTLSRDFEMAETPVTQAQWEAVMGSNPSSFKQSGSDAPVENVSWNDAVEWCTKMSEQDSGWTYRLPTEAEWEYACRAGTVGAYNVDGASLKDLGWFSDTARGSKTHSVKQKRANSWGLYDMHGNVEEWCADWYLGYPKEAVTDPKGPDGGGPRVTRGGNWADAGLRCRAAARSAHPTFGSDYVGFRPVRQRKGTEGAAEGANQTKEAATPAGARTEDGRGEKGG